MCCSHVWCGWYLTAVEYPGFDGHHVNRAVGVED